ncbi:hypothetical protein ACOME3_006923 [Neoechinorhynchus agilis]
MEQLKLSKTNENTQQAFVTLATNDTYSIAAIVLCQSIRLTGSHGKVCILITPEVSITMVNVLEQIFDRVKLVDMIDSEDTERLNILGRPELGCTYTKLHCWTFTEFSKCVFLDADILVLANIDDLFERDELSAVPDFGWPDCFNSGLFVFNPNMNTFHKLMELVNKSRSYDGADQGILNLFFNRWYENEIRKRLPISYNCPAFAVDRCVNHTNKIVHFLGKSKPWQTKEPTTEVAKRWMRIFDENVREMFIEADQWKMCKFSESSSSALFIK